MLMKFFAVVFVNTAIMAAVPVMLVHAGVSEFGARMAASTVVAMVCLVALRRFLRP